MGESKVTPRIIQGGMGIGVSSWKLARTVSQAGQLGVVSGTGIDTVMIRTLQLGDKGGHYRRALKAFPFQETAEKILKNYFVEEGTLGKTSFKRLPLPSIQLALPHQEVIVAANFAEVFLAKEDHSGIVGINLLEKMQMTNLPSLYGAMLAEVDYVLVGAGIPREIPAALQALSENQEASLKVSVVGGASEDDYRTRFSPSQVFGMDLPTLGRPQFLAIISSATLAMTLVKKGAGHVDGFVVEGANAGGHNAPPRVSGQFNEKGEPLYGPKDEVDFAAIRKLGRPFWIAGSFATREKISEALALGACGVQIGSAFALSKESGLLPSLKQSVLELSQKGSLEIFTDAFASPTYFPFKVARLAETLSESDTYQNRPRICDLGYLRQPYKKSDGTLGYRCPSEPVKTFVDKGGIRSETEGKRCLCNSLLADVGLGNKQSNGYQEKSFVTLGEDARQAARFLKNNLQEYSALDVLKSLEPSGV